MNPANRNYVAKVNKDPLKHVRDEKIAVLTADH